MKIEVKDPNDSNNSFTMKGSEDESDNISLNASKRNRDLSLSPMSPSDQATKINSKVQIKKLNKKSKSPSKQKHSSKKIMEKITKKEIGI